MPVTVCRVPPDMDHEQCLDWVEMILEDPEADAADIPAHLTVLGRMNPISLPLQQVAAIDSWVGRIGFKQEENYESYVAKRVRKDRFPVSELLELSTDRCECDASAMVEATQSAAPSMLFSISHGTADDLHGAGRAALKKYRGG